ncbi:MAG: hypothetical protein QM770_23870 [Tepidisphaeraceae bacterium]
MSKCSCGSSRFGSIVIAAAAVLGGLSIAHALQAPPTVEPATKPADEAKAPLRYEYCEVRWEVSPNGRTVAFERPGDQFRGVGFGDALDHSGLPKPMGINTPSPTSTDFFTALGIDGWELVTHAVGNDGAAVDPNTNQRVVDLHTEVWTFRRIVK